MTDRMISEILTAWHLEQIAKTGRPLPRGVLRVVSRQARELLYSEWQILEPDRVPRHHGEEQPALSPSTLLRDDGEVGWFCELLDHLWQDRYPDRQSRRQAIVNAIMEEAGRLRDEVTSEIPTSEHAIAHKIIDRRAANFRKRAGDRAGDPDVDRSVRELTDKLRLTAQVDLVFATAAGRSFLRRCCEEAAADVKVLDAWLGCGYPPKPVPTQADPLAARIGAPSDDELPAPPELTGRLPYHHLELMIDPAGPVRARPLPDWLDSALRARRESSEIRRLVAQEVRRSAFPAGLDDEIRRRKWVLAVLFVESRWTARKVATEVATQEFGDPAHAVRSIGRSTPTPETLDRVRYAAIVQGQPTAGHGQTAVDQDGWLAPLAPIVFEGAASYRFALPISVAQQAVSITTCGARLRRYFGDGDWNRAQRFGEVGIERLCSLATSRYRRRIHQRLLKEDQLEEGHLQGQTFGEWHITTTAQLKREATTTARMYRSCRPNVDDDHLQHEQSNDQPSEEPDVQLDPNVVELLNVGPRSATLLQETTAEWLARRHSRVSRSMNNRLNELTEFDRWFRAEIPLSDGDFPKPEESVLRGERVPLRQVIHRFVLTGRHRREKPGREKSTQVVLREQQRDSRLLMDAVVTMLVDLGRLPQQGGVHDRTS